MAFCNNILIFTYISIVPFLMLVKLFLNHFGGTRNVFIDLLCRFWIILCVHVYDYSIYRKEENGIIGFKEIMNY